MSVELKYELFVSRNGTYADGVLERAPDGSPAVFAYALSKMPTIAALQRRIVGHHALLKVRAGLAYLTRVESVGPRGLVCRVVHTWPDERAAYTAIGIVMARDFRSHWTAESDDGVREFVKAYHVAV